MTKLAITYRATIDREVRIMVRGRNSKDNPKSVRALRVKR